MIKTQQLAFSYDHHKTFRFPDLSVAEGGATLVLGQSGVGKSTFLHLLGLILKPQSGKIVVSDIDTAGIKDGDLPQFRAQNIGFVFQKPHFVDSLTVLDNLLLANYLVAKPILKSRAEELAMQLGFVEHLSKKTKALSLGEQQRVGIARALMNNPKVLLADEPTSALDDSNAERVVQLLKEHTQNAALVIVTHDHRLKAHFDQHLNLVS